MDLSEELNRLYELHRRGVLSEAEFTQAKARLLGRSDAPMPAFTALNTLRRSPNERWIAGVCGGLAEATGAQAWVYRLLFALLFFCGGTGLLVYLLMWIFIPPG